MRLNFKTNELSVVEIEWDEIYWKIKLKNKMRLKNEIEIEQKIRWDWNKNEIK